jgi:protease II
MLAGCQEKNLTVTRYSIDQFYKNSNIFGGSFSPDESKLLVTSNESGIYNIYEIHLESGQKSQLTNSTEESFFGQSYFPNDNRFLYTYDQGGNENYKLYMMSEGVGKNLTPGDSIRNGFWGWSRDQKSMFYSSNKRNPQFMDIYELKIASMRDEIPIGEMIYQNDDGIDVSAISPNKRYFALTQVITSADMKMYLYDREKEERTDISVHEGDAQYNPQFFSLDNRELFYTTNENSDFVYLAKRDLTSGEVEKVFEAEWDVWYTYDSWNGKYRVIGIP